MKLLKGKTTQLRITEDNLGSFLACLGIGTLFAIQTEVLAPEAGIWTLGVPRVWEPLMNKSRVAPELVEVFQTCDELSALHQLSSKEEFKAEVAKLIDRLLEELKEMPDPIWQVEWVAD